MQLLVRLKCLSHCSTCQRVPSPLHSSTSASEQGHAQVSGGLAKEPAHDKRLSLWVA